MDKTLKQRLVGAVILIALAIIFVPMLFDEGPEREVRRESVVELPPPPERREVRRLPLDPERARELPAAPATGVYDPDDQPAEISLLGPDPRPEPAPPDQSLHDDPMVTDPTPIPEADPVELPPQPESEPGPAEPLPEPQPEAAAEPVPEPPPAPPEAGAEPADGATGAFMVQVASFSSADTAARVVEQLQRLGHQASVDVTVRGDSSLHRVRAGPYSSRAEADRARAQIVATVAGVEPVVLAAPEDMAPGQAQPSAGFSVQVGSFTARVNADRLTEQLNGQGFDAFIHPEMTGPREIWRVRVGIQGSRAEAARLQRELMDRAGLESLIVSHP